MRHPARDGVDPLHASGSRRYDTQRAHGAARRGHGAQGPRQGSATSRKKLAMLWARRARHPRRVPGLRAHRRPARRATCPTWTRSREAAAPFYNNHLRGGEGHMEVGKLILNVAKAKAHMTLSVKPFGCMPSSGVSDGVQSLITEQLPAGRSSAPIETNGDGAVNFYSRVQMLLFKARLAAQAEYDAVLEENGVTVAEMRAYLKTKRWRGSSLFYPRHGTVASMAANMAQHVVDDIKKTRTAKIIDFTKRVIARGAAKVTTAHAEPERARGVVGELGRSPCCRAYRRSWHGQRLDRSKLRVLVHRRLQATGNEHRSCSGARARQHRQRYPRQADPRRRGGACGGRAGGVAGGRAGARAGAGAGLLRRQGPPHQDQGRRAAARARHRVSRSRTSPTTRRSAPGSSRPPSRKSSRSWSSPERRWAASPS